jgi:hypothetical protein
VTANVREITSRSELLEHIRRGTVQHNQCRSRFWFGHTVPFTSAKKPLDTPGVPVEMLYPTTAAIIRHVPFQTERH